uniref:Uncharacterized protein n=1 Tax=Fagus sylvatica TaxID=28930 RepID=A0A2N9GCK1_FAGSY
MANVFVLSPAPCTAGAATIGGDFCFGLLSLSRLLSSSLSLSVSLSRHFSFLSISAALSNFSSTTETLRHPWPEQELSSSHPLILMAPNLTGLMMAPL